MKWILLAVVPAVVVAGTSGAAPGPNIHDGQQIFQHWCASCHGPGIGNPGLAMKPGTAALQAKYKGAVPALLTERSDLAPEAVAYFVRNGTTIMPFFRKTEISDADLAALGRYLSHPAKTKPAAH